VSTRVAVRKILAVAGRVPKSQTSLPVFKLKVRSSGKIRALSHHLDHSRKGLHASGISLTRDIPAGLGWMVGPFVSSVPKESLEHTLGSTRSAVLAKIAVARTQ